MNFAFLLQSGNQNPLGSLSTLVIMGVFILIFYFLVLRPQKKKEKEEAQMRDNIEIGDEITTIGGIIGKIVSIKDETFVLETTKDKTKIRFLKGAIRSVDVKAADIAAAILETKEVEAKEADEIDPASLEAVASEVVEESKKDKKKNKKG